MTSLDLAAFPPLATDPQFSSNVTAAESCAYEPLFESPGSTGDASTRLAVAKIMIVDDEPINVKVVRRYLSDAGYRNFVTTTSPSEVPSLLGKERPDALLLDIVMPEVSGLDILRQIRADPHHAHLPVVILTAVDDRDTMVCALELGATDFLRKPIDSVELVPRVRNALVVKAHHDHLESHALQLEKQVLERTAELSASRLEVIHCLARAAEYRDNDTGRHVIRVARYVRVIAEQLGLDSATVELFELAAPLHDIGKLGVPDAILLKPGKLDPEEFEVMQRHCALGKRTFEPMSQLEWESIKAHTRVGEKILNVAPSPIITVASRIALTHHERWDGSGYPLGLAGADIPLEGRITAVADVFDALSTKRPYKPALPLDQCFAVMEEGRARHFDPDILDAFFAGREEIVSVRLSFADLD